MFSRDMRSLQRSADLCLRELPRAARLRGNWWRTSEATLSSCPGTANTPRLKNSVAMIENGTEHLHEGLGCGGDVAWAKLVEVSSRNN